MKFAHVGLNCIDPIALESWYCTYFGFRRERALPVDDWELVFISRGDLTLELFKTERESPAGRPDKDGPAFRGVRHLAFQVDDVDAVLASIDGVNVTLGPVSFDEVIPGWRTAWISDPEGNIIEISQGYHPDPQLA